MKRVRYREILRLKSQGLSNTEIAAAARRSRNTAPVYEAASLLGMVNALHQQLKGFLGRFAGVSTRHLGHYLAWFQWVEQTRRSGSRAARSRVRPPPGLTRTSGPCLPPRPNSSGNIGRSRRLCQWWANREIRKAAHPCNLLFVIMLTCRLGRTGHGLVPYRGASMQNPSVPLNEVGLPERISKSEIPLILGPGLLFAASVGLLNILGRAANSATVTHLFPAALIGALASGLLAVGLSRPIRRLAEKNCLRAFRATVTLTGAVTIVVCIVARTDLISNIMLGAGVSTLAILWANVFSYRPFLMALQSLAGTLAVGTGALGLAMVSAPDGNFIIAVACIELLASVVCLLKCLGSNDSLSNGFEAPLPPDEPEETQAPLKERVAATIRAIWIPLAGLSACMFLLGVLWRQSAQLNPGATTPPPPAASFIPFATMLLLTILSSRLPDLAAAKRFIWSIVPLVAAMFLITPNFENVGTASWNALVEGLQNTGSCAQMLCSFALILVTSRACDLPVTSVTGAALFIVASAGLAGYVAHDTVGQTANIMAVILFILYACTAIGFLAVFGAGDREAYDKEAGILESYLAPRCDALANSCSLTQREDEVLRLLSRGHSYAYIAETMYVSEATVRTHARNVYRKLGVINQEGLINLVDKIDPSA